MKTVNETSTEVKNAEKKFKARLNYYENRKGMSHDEAVMLASRERPAKEPSDQAKTGQSTWAQRQADKKAREEATKAHPLGLDTCPFCGDAFFRKVKGEGKMVPITMDHCDPCSKRFYFFNGVKQ